VLYATRIAEKPFELRKISNRLYKRKAAFGDKAEVQRILRKLLAQILARAE
jgi:hypothetical protein